MFFFFKLINDFNFNFHFLLFNNFVLFVFVFSLCLSIFVVCLCESMLEDDGMLKSVGEYVEK